MYSVKLFIIYIVNKEDSNNTVLASEMLALFVLEITWDQGV